MQTRRFFSHCVSIPWSKRLCSGGKNRRISMRTRRFFASRFTTLVKMLVKFRQKSTHINANAKGFHLQWSKRLCSGGKNRRISMRTRRFFASHFTTLVKMLVKFRQKSTHINANAKGFHLQWSKRLCNGGKNRRISMRTRRFFASRFTTLVKMLVKFRQKSTHINANAKGFHLQWSKRLCNGGKIDAYQCERAGFFRIAFH